MKEKSKKIGLIILFACFILSFVCLVASCTIKTKNSVKNSENSEICALASCGQQLNAYIYNSETEILTSTNKSPVSTFKPSEQADYDGTKGRRLVTSCNLENLSELNFGVTCFYTTNELLANYKLVFVPNQYNLTANNYMNWPSVTFQTGTNQTLVGQITNIDHAYNWSWTNVYLMRGNWQPINSGVNIDNLNIFTYSNTTDFNNKRAYTPLGDFQNKSKIEDNLEYEKELSYYNGYNDGLALAENNLSETVYTIIDAPFGILYQILNFDILGVNLWLVVTGIFTLVLVIWVVKKFRQ